MSLDPHSDEIEGGQLISELGSALVLRLSDRKSVV